MKLTAKDVADYMGVDYVIASGLMTMLVSKGLATHVENRKSATGKGKPTRVFEVNSTVQLELASEITQMPIPAFKEAA